MIGPTAALIALLLVGGRPDQEPQRITFDASFKQHLQWSPDGKELLFTRIHQGKMALWLMRSDGQNLRRLMPDLRQPHFDGHWSPDGKRIVYVYDELQGTDGKLRIHTCKPDGSDDQTLIPHKAFEESPRFSPDGKLIVWVSTREGNPELYTVTSDGKDQKRLTNEPAYDLHPNWMPDGKRIVFSSGRSGRQKLYMLGADGQGARRLTDGESLESWPTPRPKSDDQLAYVSMVNGNYEIFLLDRDGKTRRNLTNHPAQETSPSWSPDGKKLAFVSTRAGGSDVFVMEVPGGKTGTMK